MAKTTRKCFKTTPLALAIYVNDAVFGTTIVLKMELKLINLFIKQATLYNYPDYNTVAYFTKTARSSGCTGKGNRSCPVLAEAKRDDCRSGKIPCPIA